MHLNSLIKESIRSGTIASLVMMPLGFLFKMLDLRVGHYGPKLAALLVVEPGPIFMFVQHLVIGWVSALPLLVMLIYWRRFNAPIYLGALYGLAYYLIVNSLALPWVFGDVTPWQLGFDTMYPSALVHLVFGASIGFTAKKFAATAID